MSEAHCKLCADGSVTISFDSTVDVTYIPADLASRSRILNGDLLDVSYGGEFALPIPISRLQSWLQAATAIKQHGPMSLTAMNTMQLGDAIAVRFGLFVCVTTAVPSCTACRTQATPVLQEADFLIDLETVQHISAVLGRRVCDVHDNISCIEVLVPFPGSALNTHVTHHTSFADN